METFLRFGLGNAAMAAVLACVAAVAGRPLAARPAWRHGLWLLVLLKLLTPPVSMVPVGWTMPAIDRGGQGGAVVEAVPGAIEAGPLQPFELETEELVALSSAPSADSTPLARSLTRFAGIVWLSGSVLALVLAGMRIRRWNRVLESLVRAPDAVHEEVERLSGRMGLRYAPGVWWSPGTSAPMLWAFGDRPRLIIPETLWERLDERQRTTLLVHELAHLLRKDHWVRLLELLASALYWWLPLVWWARRALREAEEQCCDAWVIWACPDKVRTYAETLLETVDFLSDSQPVLPLAASGFGQVHHLKRRISMIMQGTTPRDLGWTGLLGMFGISALLLPVSPTWGQDPEAKPTKDAPVVVASPETSGESNVADLVATYLDDDDTIQFVARTRDDDPPIDESETADTPEESKRIRERKEAKERQLKKLAEHRELLLKKIQTERMSRLEDVKKLRDLKDPKKLSDLKEATEGQLKRLAEQQELLLRKLEAEKRSLQKLDAEELNLKLVDPSVKVQGEQSKQFKLSTVVTGSSIAKEDKGQLIPAAEIQRARSEVERARAALRAAEQRLAKLQTEGKTITLFKTRKDHTPFVVDVVPRATAPKRSATVVTSRIHTDSAEHDKRLAELEKRLAELASEVKSLKQGPREEK